MKCFMINLGSGPGFSECGVQKPLLARNRCGRHRFSKKIYVGFLWCPAETITEGVEERAVHSTHVNVSLFSIQRQQHCLLHRPRPWMTGVRYINKGFQGLNESPDFCQVQFFLCGTDSGLSFVNIEKKRRSFLFLSCIARRFN